MTIKYVNTVSPASVEFAHMMIDLLDELPEDAGADMMRFIYGNGQ